MKKKVLFGAVLVVAVLIMCVGCAQESKLSGTYVCEITPAIGSVPASTQEFTFDGKGGWTYGARVNGEIVASTRQSGKYTVSGTTVTIKGFGGGSIAVEGTLNGDNFTFIGYTYTKR